MILRGCRMLLRAPEFEGWAEDGGSNSCSNRGAFANSRATGEMLRD